MSANEHQVGGSHYKTGGEEHWDRVWRLYGSGYFVGSITKYVERYHLKDGIKDLKKALHFLEKLIELEEVKSRSLDTTKDSGVKVLEAEEVSPNQVRPKVCPHCQRVAGMVVHGRPDPNCPYCHGRGGDKGLNLSDSLITSPQENRGNTERFEPCCECGEEYPYVDLLAGYVYCLKCREKNLVKLPKD